MKNLILIGSLVLITSIIACSNNRNEQAATTGQQQTSTDSNTATSQPVMPTLPAFAVVDANGNILHLENLKGKKVFVNLWASWCPPCKREMPSIAKLYKSIDTNKVTFVMVSLDDKFEKAKAFVRAAKLHLPVFYPAENLPPLFNVEGIPSTFIFNENGELIKRVDGGDQYNTDEYRTLLK